MKATKRPRFPGLTLSDDDRLELKQLRRGFAMSDRQWRRLRTLEMLDRGEALATVARALGTYPREVRRVGWRYLEAGLQYALTEDHRYTPPSLLDDRQSAQIVALACTDPPEGRARWTIALLAEEACRCKIVKIVSRETVRKLLAQHDLKPWREKMWCVPTLDEEYIKRMEDILDLLEKPVNHAEPVVALDERPVPLHADVRRTKPSRPGRPGQRDSEYRRHGVANVFAIVAPHEGRHLTHATANRKGPKFASALKRIARSSPGADTIHLIVDNLSTHTQKSLTVAFGTEEGEALWSRFTLHYTQSREAG